MRLIKRLLHLKPNQPPLTKFALLYFFVPLGIGLVLAGCITKGTSTLDKTGRLFLDSLRIQKNILLPEAYVMNEILCPDYEGEALFLVASCKVCNASKDTVMLTNGGKNVIDRICNLLYSQGNNYFIKPATCYGDYAVPTFDTLPPNSQKPYFIPFFAIPKRYWGDAFYAELKIDGKVFGRRASELTYGKCDTIFRFLLHSNIRTNKIRYVDSTFRQVMETYKARGWKLVYGPDSQ